MSDPAVSHDTIQVRKQLPAPVAAVWAAFADTQSRAEWGVPQGEEQVYSHDDLRSGGTASYRCGTPGVLQFHGEVRYLEVAAPRLVIHTDLVRDGDQALSAALLTWEFQDGGDITTVCLTDQVTSCVGSDMIDGHRNGHTLALEQLAEFLAR